jgi:murein DD-endopeptidase MepM/ murein hydrolase activator NlpD
MKHFNVKYWFWFALIFFQNCAIFKEKFPEEIKQEPRVFVNKTEQKDLLIYSVSNTLACPIQFQEIKTNTNFILAAKKDTTLTFDKSTTDTKDLKFKYFLGDYSQPIKSNFVFAFPFKEKNTIKVTQPYNSAFSHNNKYSQYAIDFSLRKGDMVYAAQDGYIIQIVDGYKKHGTSQKWRDNDRSNYITIYHPQSGLFSQYVHLKKNSAMVKINDFVNKGQCIAKVDLTGFTTIEHLHFVVKKPVKDNQPESVPTVFENGIKGEDLKKDDVIVN